MHNEPTQARVEWFHPGEVVIVAHVRKGANALDHMPQALRRHIGDEVSREARVFSFEAPDEERSLVFLIHKLARSDSPRAVKDVVEALHGRLADLGSAEIDVVSAMPHWHLRAHEGFSGGSPGSLPTPVYPDQVRDRPARREYTPLLTELRPADRPSIPVAVLDTRWDPRQARERASRLRESANNQQLLETVELLSPSLGHEDGFAGEWQEVQQHHGAPTTMGVGPAA